MSRSAHNRQAQQQQLDLLFDLPEEARVAIDHPKITAPEVGEHTQHKLMPRTAESASDPLASQRERAAWIPAGDLKTYSAREAEAEWARSSIGFKRAILGRVGLGRDNPVAEKAWEELEPAERKLMHAALNEDHFTGSWYTNTKGQRVERFRMQQAAKSAEQLMDEEGAPLWEALPFHDRESIMYSIGIGEDAQQGKFAKWGDMGRDVRARLLAAIKARQKTADPVESGKPSVSHKRSATVAGAQARKRGEASRRAGELPADVLKAARAEDARRAQIGRDAIAEYGIDPKSVSFTVGQGKFTLRDGTAVLVRENARQRGAEPYYFAISFNGKRVGIFKMEYRAPRVFEEENLGGVDEAKVKEASEFFATYHNATYPGLPDEMLQAVANGQKAIREEQARAAGEPGRSSSEDEAPLPADGKVGKGSGMAAADEQQAAPVQQVESFDGAAWNKARDDRIKKSKEAGYAHLDDVPPYVETMRGEAIYNVHDPKERGTIRTVDSRGNVYVNWADQYSAEKNLASPTVQGNKEVFQTSLGPTDLQDYVFAKPAAELQSFRGMVRAAPGGSLAEAPGSKVATTNSAQRGQQGASSWVIREKDTGAVVMETSDRKKVEALNTNKYEAVPIQQHLHELNDPNSKARKAADYAAYRKDRKEAVKKIAEPARAAADREVPLTLKLHRDFVQNHVQILAELERRGLMDALRKQAALRDISHWDARTIAAKGDDYVRLVQSGVAPIEVGQSGLEAENGSTSLAPADPTPGVDDWIRDRVTFIRGGKWSSPDFPGQVFSQRHEKPEDFYSRLFEKPWATDAQYRKDGAAEDRGEDPSQVAKSAAHAAPASREDGDPAHSLSDEQINDYAARMGNTPDNVRRIATFHAAQGVKDVAAYLENSIRTKVENEARAAAEKASLEDLTGKIIVRGDKAYQLEPISTDKRVREKLPVVPVNEFPTQGVDLWEHYIGHPDSPFVRLQLETERLGASTALRDGDDAPSENLADASESDEDSQSSTLRRMRP